MAGMPRTARASVGEICYHVINRGNGRAEVFHKWQGIRGRKNAPEFLSDGPVERDRNWQQTVNRPMTEAEMLAIRTSVNRGTPWGNPDWQKRTAGQLGLESSLRPKGRPRLEKKK